MVKFKYSQFSGLYTWFKLFIPVVMVVLIPVLAKYLLNSYQLSIQEIWFPVAINIVTAALVTAVFYRLWRHNRLAAYIGAVLAAATFTNGYDGRFLFIEPVLQAIIPLPKLADSLYSLIFIFIILASAYWIGRGVARITAARHWKPHSLMMAATIAIAATFVLQVLPAIRNIAVAWPQFFYTPPKLTPAPKTALTAAKPDIYYIILDRYASPEVLKTQFGYDNADFLHYLSDNQFYVRPDGHQNYPYTAQSVASTMNANYNTDMIKKFGTSSVQTIIPYDQTIRNSAVAQHLKNLGYKYNLVGNWYETSNLSPLANKTFIDQGLLTVFNHTYTIDNFTKNELLDSMYWRLLQPGLSFGKYVLYGYDNAGGDQMTLNQIKALKTLAQAPAGGRLVFAHLLVPHDPYYFNADGSINPNKDDDNMGAPIKQKYLNQVKFINEQIKPVLDQIKQHSHNQAIIVLQSDEGPYPLDINQETMDQSTTLDELDNGSMLKWSTQDLKMKFGNLAAYYIPAASASDLEAGATSVNIFRLVLNNLYGEGLPYLPECYYAYPNGRAKPFYYKSINLQLTGQLNPVCSDNGTGPKP